MTRRIDQQDGALVLQDYGGRSIASRSAIWACRQIEDREDFRYTVSYETLGDVLCATVFYSPTGQITGEERKFAERKPAAAWAFAWPVRVMSATSKEESREGGGDEEEEEWQPGDGLDYPQGAVEENIRDMEGSGIRPVGAEEDVKDENDGGAEPSGRNKDDQPNCITAAPIWHDKYDYDARFVDADHYIPKWKNPYPQNYIALSLGATEESEQHRLLLSGDDAIIAPNKNGPGVMGTLVHDLEPEGVMTRAEPPGVMGRAARFQTFARVAKIKVLRKLKLSFPHNSVCWNLSPTGQDGKKGFGGMGAVFGPMAVGKKKKDDKRDKDSVPSEDYVAATAADAAGSGITAVESESTTVPADSTQGTKKKSEETCVAYAEKDAYGPFLVGFGKKDKHIHGYTYDGETIHPLHIDTRAIYANRSNYEQDAALDFDHDRPYVPAHTYGMLSEVWLRYDGRSSHDFMGDQLPGLWRWETTVPYYSSDGPPRPPITPPPGGPPDDDDDQPPPPHTRPPGGGGPDQPTEPREPRDPGQPGEPREPVPEDADRPPPWAGGDDGDGDGGHVDPEPDSGDGGGGGSDDTSGARPDTDEHDEGGGLDLNDPDAPWNPGDPWEPPDLRDPIGPLGRHMPPWGRGGRHHWVRGYDHGSGVRERHIMHPETEGFADVVFRPQHATGRVQDFRQGNYVPREVYAEDRRRPVVLRAAAFGAEADGEWVHAEDPLTGRHKGGTAAGGLVFMPAACDLLDHEEDFDPVGATVTDAYVTAAPGVYWATGTPDVEAGDLDDGAYRWAPDSAGLLVVGHKSSGSWTDIVKIDENAIDAHASGMVFRVEGGQVVKARITGWSTATGTATRTTFDTGSVTLEQLAERVKALIDDLHGTAGHGLIGT